LIADEAGDHPCLVAPANPWVAGNEWRRVNGADEQQPAEEADAEDAEDESDDEQGGSRPDTEAKGCAFHHQHGAGSNIEEGEVRRQRKIDGAFPPPPEVIDAFRGWKGWHSRMIVAGCRHIRPTA
jgi:hypothetical protein